MKMEYEFNGKNGNVIVNGVDSFEIINANKIRMFETGRKRVTVVEKYQVNSFIIRESETGRRLFTM